MTDTLKQKQAIRVLLLAVLLSAVLGMAMAIPAYATTGVNVEYHTQDEIRDFVNKSGAALNDKLTYTEAPDLSLPYSAGVLSDATLTSAVKMLNQIRYIAGVPYQVQLSEPLNEKAQAATLANYLNNQLSHYPEQPNGMTDALYALAKEGASSSNIAWASWAGRSLNQTQVLSWMQDGDTSNIDRLGHRRWMINPTMGKVGFGAVSGANGTYSAVYVFDRSNSSADQYGVMWPAQNMPIAYFDTSFPWSVSMGTTVNKSKVNVTLVRRADGKTWSFSDSSADGYFNVDNQGYGQTGCIIFRPDAESIGEYKPGDIYDVTITGTPNGDVSYSVNFFDWQATTITLNKTSVEVKAGEEVTLKATVDGSNEDVKWSSSNVQVATVNQNGTVTGIKEGTATITAAVGEVTATCKITVTEEAARPTEPSENPTKPTDPTTSPVTPTEPSEAPTEPSVEPETPTTPEQPSVTTPTEQPSISVQIKPGMVVQDKNSKASYVVTKTGSSNTVTYKTSTDSKKTAVTIPATVKIAGTTYQVTKISNNAFKNNSKIKTVKIGANIQTIGTNAFNKCTKLVSVTIPSKVKTIQKGAFANCKNLKSITIKTTKLTQKSVGKNAFKGTAAKVKVKTPKGKAQTYKKLFQSKGLSKKATVK